jgi:hypothetical protein
LLRIQDELNHVNPSAARSLEEGLEETLTLHRLKVPVELWKTLHSTNVIESAFLDCSHGLPQREAMAAWQSNRTLGRFRPRRC